MIKLVLDEKANIAEKFGVESEKIFKYDLYYVVKKRNSSFLGVIMRKKYSCGCFDD